MRKVHLLVLGGLAVVGIVAAMVSFRPEPSKNTNCKVEIRERAESPEGDFSAEHHMGICDEGKTVLHTLEIAPSDRDPAERFIGAVLYRSEGADARPSVLSMRFELRWLDNRNLEVSYPKDVAVASEPFELEGVRVIGRGIE